MSMPAVYNVGNLQNDAASLTKSLTDALNSEDHQQIRNAWTDAAVTSAKIVSGMAYLVADDPKWGGIVGSLSTLAALGLSADHIRDAAQSGGTDAIKVGDILGVVGGISELSGNFLVKPGPLLVAGLTLKGAGLVAGVAQNIVADQTIGQLMGASTANNNAPDGVTPLNTMISTEVGNHRVHVYWSRNANGEFTKNESISSVRADGTLNYTNFTQYQYGRLKRLVGNDCKGAFIYLSANDVNWQKSA
ncbi:MAG: hypothetical protein ACRYGA_06730 [Janthinobacterium lividum]